MFENYSKFMVWIVNSPISPPAPAIFPAVLRSRFLACSGSGICLERINGIGPSPALTILAKFTFSFLKLKMVEEKKNMLARQCSKSQAT